MSKTEADWCKKIEIWWLLRDMKNSKYKDTTILWGTNGDKGSIGCEVNLWGDEKFVRFYYAQTSRDTSEKEDFDYKVPLTTTPCRYGGSRYWFRCLLYKNGVYCGRRVGVLYKNGDLFGCRHCYNLTYSSRNISGLAKPFGRVINIREIEKMREKVKRTNYKGKPTKKYLRYLKMDERAEQSFIGIARLLSGKAKRILRATKKKK
ncbi:MAG: hypothetical protein UT05_C0004G0060 [Parcubacteria group bacterium GW2011_GWF2_38_76]|nr:MAG: hypothetical protein UT05_C0004G0060 [Parcubacteria group bacterium GW2011_GWF2_38_76]HBM45638.1 hypothetical protein [Patescibacteria group bacterium]